MVQSDTQQTDNRLKASISGFVNDHFIPIMVGPALIAIFIIFLYPIIHLLFQSLHRVTLATGGYQNEFVSFGNFQRVLQSSAFWEYLGNTLLYSFGSLALSVSGGLLFALTINHVERSWLRTVYSTLILISWASPLVVTGLIWGWVLNMEVGLLNMILVDLGLSRIGWLVDPTLAMASVIFVDAWIRTPFATIVLLAGLQSIPQHMYDAAKMDGATTFQTFRNVTLPHLLPSFAIVILINWMFSFRAFSIVWTLTKGGPGSATEVLATHIYRNGIVSFSLGYASAVAVILVLITLAVAAFVVTKIMVDVEE